MTTRSRERRRRLVGALLVTGLALGVAACSTENDRKRQVGPDPITAPVAKVDLTLGVWGSKPELAVFQDAVDRFNEESTVSTVTLKTWRDHDEAMSDLRAGAPEPDVFLASRRDLAWLTQDRRTTPVDELLDERFVDFGDGYSRDALEAFSVDRRLQCMPYGISPQVIFYNADLVDFVRMSERGLDAPTSTTKWSFDQFTAAAQFATKPRRKSRGVYIEPSLRGLAPFIYSGGGRLFDDEDTPTSLAFSDDSTKNALERTLELLRNSTVTLTSKQLAQADPLTWFERGRLGMIAGDRSLVPVLRKVPGLRFDVMPMPTLDSAATVGELSGLCLNPRTESISASADLLVDLISEDVVRKLARTGYLVPANQEVALSDDFLQPKRQPANAGVFTYAIRSMVVPPLLDTWTELQATVDPTIRRIVDRPGVLDLDAETAQVDELSRSVLAPEETESPSPSDASSESPSE